MLPKIYFFYSNFYSNYFLFGLHNWYVCLKEMKFWKKVEAEYILPLFIYRQVMYQPT